MRGRVHSQGRTHRLPPRWNAYFVVAGLVANFRRDFGSTRRGAWLQLQLNQENRGTFVSLRIQLEVGIVSFLGRRFEYPEFLDRVIRRDLDSGGDGPRAGHRVDVPTGIDPRLQTRQNLGPGSRRALQ